MSKAKRLTLSVAIGLSLGLLATAMTVLGWWLAFRVPDPAAPALFAVVALVALVVAVYWALE